MTPRATWPGLDRRRFLIGSAATAVSLPALASVLAACGNGNGNGAAVDVDDLSAFNGTPENPVRLPVTDDNPPIADGLSPESGPLRIYNYADYLNPETLDAFGEAYGVDWELTTFTTMTEALARLRTGQVSFDVFFPTEDVLGRVVAGGLLQPLNKTYLSNFSEVWPVLQDPFYDLGSQYTVPYTAYTTGIGYRADEVDGEIFTTEGYAALFDPAFAGQLFLLDDYREAISAMLLYQGIADLNTENPDLLEQALGDLRYLTDNSNVRVSIEAYSRLPENLCHVHQAWSGDLLNAQYYLPEGVEPDVLGYWYTNDGTGMVGNDTMAVMRDAQHPVLAHAFLDFMLDPENALDNFGFVGYQPPITELSADRLVNDEFVPENLTNALVPEPELGTGIRRLGLSPEGEVLWQATWAEFLAG